MTAKSYFALFVRLSLTLTLLFPPFFCSAKISFQELIGKRVIMPDCFSNTTEYTFIHVVRNQECTKCSVSSLYQWNDVIAMIGRKDISYYFIVETRPEDVQENISKALKRRPFFQPLFVDYANVFLETNQWLKRKKYKEINDFVVDRTGAIVEIGDPLNDIHFLIHLKNAK